MVKLSSTEEEYTEFLSSLWATYKILIIIGLLVVGVGIVGYEYWSKTKINNLQDSSDLYESFVDSLNNPEDNEIDIAKKIIRTYPSTIYADLVTLHIAKIMVDQNNLDEAKIQLEWILEKHSSKWFEDFNPIESVARLRLAKVLIAKNNPSEALVIITKSTNMNASLYEVRGDAEEKLGRIEQAKLSYLKAIESTESTSVKGLINMKLANLNIEEK